MRMRDDAIDAMLTRIEVFVVADAVVEVLKGNRLQIPHFRNHPRDQVRLGVTRDRLLQQPIDLRLVLPRDTVEKFTQDSVEFRAERPGTDVDAPRRAGGGRRVHLHGGGILQDR